MKRFKVVRRNIITMGIVEETHFVDAENEDDASKIIDDDSISYLESRQFDIEQKEALDEVVEEL